MQRAVGGDGRLLRQGGVRGDLPARGHEEPLHPAHAHAHLPPRARHARAQPARGRARRRADGRGGRRGRERRRRRGGARSLGGGGASDVRDTSATRPRHAPQELARWEAAISELSCPASSSLEAFLLPTDDPRVHTAREDLSHIDPTKQRGVVDWGRCETRHQRARTDEELGAKRPLTQWVSQGHCAGPDFAWHDWCLRAESASGRDELPLHSPPPV